MRTAVDIYAEYRVPPWLQLHQLRVAALGSLLASRIAGTDIRAVVLACLFHDMGNILKFDLTPSAQLADMVPEGERDYWIGVQDDFEARYGKDEHRATETIADEIGLPSAVQGLIRGMGFAKAASIAREGSIELQAVEYADQRVGPHGILSLDGRLRDGSKRYAGRYGMIPPEEKDRYQENVQGLYAIESRLVALSGLQPDDINDQAIAPTIEELRAYEV